MENQKTLCILGWCACFAVLLYLFAEKFLEFHLRIFWPPCLFHLFTGYYCPGCGGTRSALALFHGQIVKSIVYHPVVPYGAGLFLWALVSNTVEILSHGKLHIGFRFRKRHAAALLTLTVIHFVGVNWCKWYLGIDFLAK